MPKGIRNDGQKKRVPPTVVVTMTKFAEYKNVLKSVGVNTDTWTLLTQPGESGYIVFGMESDQRDSFPASFDTRSEVFDLCSLWITAVNLGLNANRPVADAPVETASSAQESVKPSKVKPEKAS